MPWITPRGAAKTIAEKITPRGELKGNGAQKKRIPRGVLKVFVHPRRCFFGGEAFSCTGAFSKDITVSLSFRQLKPIK